MAAFAPRVPRPFPASDLPIMDLQRALHGRRTVKRYRPEPVPEAIVERALRAAIVAPNHRLTWPWRFIRTGPVTRNALVALARSAKGGPVTEDVDRALRSQFLDPGELIVVVQMLATDPKIRREDYAACACAIQNLCLSFHADGIGTKWGTGALTTAPATFALLDLDPTATDIVGFLYAGVPEIVPDQPERPPLETFVRQLP